MKVLAIGATGFLGPHVAGHLVRMGHEVAVFHRGETEANLPDSVRQVRGDRNDLPEHQDAFETFAPDVVLDVIPYTEAQARRAGRSSAARSCNPPIESNLSFVS